MTPQCTKQGWEERFPPSFYHLLPSLKHPLGLPHFAMTEVLPELRPFFRLNRVSLRVNRERRSAYFGNCPAHAGP